MTDLDQLLARIAAVLDDCDANKLPPVVKLTRDQFDTLAEQSPAPNRPEWMSGGLNTIAGVPIQLVDNADESTPHQLRHGGPAFEPAPIALHPVGEVVRFDDLPWWRRILWRRIFLRRHR